MKLKLLTIIEVNHGKKTLSPVRPGEILLEEFMKPMSISSTQAYRVDWF